MFNAWIPGMAAFAFFTYALFPKYFSKRFAHFLAIYTIPFYIYILLSEPRDFVTMTLSAQFLAIILGTYVFFVVTKAVIKEEEGARLYLAGAFIFIFASFHDVFMTSGLFQSLAAWVSRYLTPQKADFIISIDFASFFP